MSKGLHKFATKEEPGKKELKKALSKPAARIETFLHRAITGEGEARNFKRGIIRTLSYFIAHESHHRGSIPLTPKQSGYKVEQGVAYGIWDRERV